MPRSVVTLGFLLFFSATVFSQTITFNQEQFASQGFPMAQADFNGDGLLDIVTVGKNSQGKGGFYISLSNADGSYQAPVFYTSPYSGGAVVVAVGDFNHDGKPDVAEVEGTQNYYIFLNKGDGTLLPSWNFATPFPSSTVATGDFNHDGKLDLVLFDPVQGWLYLFYGTGTGTFSAPFKIAPSSFVDNLFIGDYDGDGNADLASTWAHCERGTGCATHIRVYYGDGKGNFSVPSALDYDQDFYFSSDNVNSDPFSDLLGVSGSSSDLRILYGNAGRNFTVRDVALAQPGVSPVAADLNGDGVKDIALIEPRAGSAAVAVLLGNLDGSYQAEQFIGSGSGLGALLAGLYRFDTKPDLMAWRPLDAGNGAGEFDFFSNTTAGNFATCQPPRASVGIDVCAPFGAVTSPVQFALGAGFTSPLRKLEVWVDGQKGRESFNSLAAYAFLQEAVILPAGVHQVDVYSASYDNQLQHTTFMFTVLPAGAAQYQASLYRTGPGVSVNPDGDVSVDTAGKVRVRVMDASANANYALQFCPAPAQLYPNCLTVGALAADAAGRVNASMQFPQSGLWAGDFNVTLNGQIAFGTNLTNSAGQVYFSTLQPDTTVNDKGEVLYPSGQSTPQDQLSAGTFQLEYGAIHVQMIGASPNTIYTAGECPLYFGSDCYALYSAANVGAFTSDGSGDLSFSVLSDQVTGDILSVDPSKNAYGFIGGFRVP